MWQSCVSRVAVATRIHAPVRVRPGVAAARLPRAAPSVPVMRTIPSHRPSDLDDGPQRDDLVVVLLEVAIAVVFAGLIGLALLWVG